MAAANINIAVRACKANKDSEFLQRAFCACESHVQKLITAAGNRPEAIYEYLETTAYADAIAAIKESPAAFDRWCDNRIIQLIRRRNITRLQSLRW